MNWGFLFFFNSILLGVGLAIDAFSVSIANAIADPKMKRTRMCLIAGTFCFFQIIMPLIGWFCVHEVVEYFKAFQPFIPYIALLLLLYIGGKMLIEAIKGGEEEEEVGKLSFSTLMVQGVATSIDALSVGFAIADYQGAEALVASLLIGVVTFFICMGGLIIGKTVGNKFSSKASILGGVILILIGIEVFIKGVFF
ncbi:MAG: manganese efflux pump [Spirochaetales bacterium]|nr:manganese efflux pump [Candidatus Physcosoma equi]